MLLSVIEGSTALLGRLDDQYGEALAAQRAIMRAAISASGGHEMGTEGDSYQEGWWLAIPGTAAGSTPATLPLPFHFAARCLRR